MPFTAEQISYAGKAAIDYIVRKKPEDWNWKKVVF